ncbi:MAG TPA: hypothetical protein VMB85_00595, partial [Bryobacteraceae bacterium]|nr:hypothetical protein [Bryobacteraceae bacterium]
MAANANALLIEIWPIDRLRPYPRNPRKNDCAVDRMCASIRAFENIIGRKVVINSQPGTIVGVLPPDFYFLDRKTDIWGCLGLDPARDYRKTSGAMDGGRRPPAGGRDHRRGASSHDRARQTARKGIPRLQYELDRE